MLKVGNLAEISLSIVAATGSYGKKRESAATISSNETSSVIFLTPDPIIYIFDGTEEESEVIKQLELNFTSQFVEKILLSLDGEEIELFPDRIMIIGVLDAHDNLIYYYSVKGSTNQLGKHLSGPHVGTISKDTLGAPIWGPSEWYQCESMDPLFSRCSNRLKTTQKNCKQKTVISCRGI